MNKWVVDFLNDMVEAEFDAFPVDVKSKVVHISNLIEEFGLQNVGMPYVKHLQGKLWEIRASGKDAQGRCLYVAVVERRVVIVRCFLKKTQTTPLKEIRVALERAGRIDE